MNDDYSIQAYKSGQCSTFLKWVPKEKISVDFLLNIVTRNSLKLVYVHVCLCVRVCSLLYMYITLAVILPSR